MGLLKIDAEWREAVAEAFASSFRLLTCLYATIIAYIEPTHPKYIWASQLHRLKEDFRLRYRYFQHERQRDDVVVSYELEAVH